MLKKQNVSLMYLVSVFQAWFVQMVLHLLTWYFVNATKTSIKMDWLDGIYLHSIKTAWWQLYNICLDMSWWSLHLCPKLYKTQWSKGNWELWHACTQRELLLQGFVVHECLNNPTTVLNRQWDKRHSRVDNCSLFLRGKLEALFGQSWWRSDNYCNKDAPEFSPFGRRASFVEQRW